MHKAYQRSEYILKWNHELETLLKDCIQYKRWQTWETATIYKNNIDESVK